MTIGLSIDKKIMFNIKSQLTINGLLNIKITGSLDLFDPKFSRFILIDIFSQTCEMHKRKVFCSFITFMRKRVRLSLHT